MHAQLLTFKNQLRQRAGLGLSLCLFLSACATTEIQPTVDVEQRDILTEPPLTDAEEIEVTDPVYTQRELEVRDLDRQRAERYQRQAQQSNNSNDQINARLSAAEHYIQAQRSSEAAAVLEPINSLQLNQVQEDRRDVILAYVAYQNRQPLAALSQLRGIWNRKLPTVEGEQTRYSIQQVDALLLESFCYQSLGDYNSAIAKLIEREGALQGTARAETSRYIWQVINSLSHQRQLAIIELSNNYLVKNRVEQVLNSGTSPSAKPAINDIESAQRYQPQHAERPQPNEFEQWSNQGSRPRVSFIEDLWTQRSPRQIAILLPLSSRYSKAAQALLDGIKHQHQLNQSPYAPTLSVYDIGADPFAINQYFYTAVRAGVDLVIGPLGNDYTNQLDRNLSSRTSTLLLGGTQPLSGRQMRFTLSPEQEGVQLAERAWNDGHFSAAILTDGSKSNQRLAAAFKRHWASKGGKIAHETAYSPKQFDHSVELKQLFAINQSHYRHKKISGVLGFEPKFQAHQRGDIDFVLMLAKDKTGRLVRPQINFFGGSNLPVYSGSAVFNGMPDTVNNIDLDGTRFPSMPWVLQAADQSTYAGQLNRLFALGADAYSVAGAHRQLSQSSLNGISGYTGVVQLELGTVNFSPVWAKFREGEAVALEPLSENRFADKLRSDQNNLDRNQGKRTYNEKTWDPENSKPLSRP